jgi:hypothetical protein
MSEDIRKKYGDRRKHCKAWGEGLTKRRRRKKGRQDVKSGTERKRKVAEDDREGEDE